ncbi:cytochrome P450 [Marmoricola sp. OAE513]|uniref:cytochrome P450 n=1 Tax=Marmoricola sp. OAE513 TaxID=2817894 RepID=UPI001DE6A68F
MKQRVRWALDHALPRTVMSYAARKGDLPGRLIVESGVRETADLVDLFDAARASGPIHQGSFSFTTASQSTVKEILTSPDFRTGIVRAGGPFEKIRAWADVDMLGPLTPPSLLVTEPPDHTRYRKLVTRVFTVRAVEQLRGRTEQIANDLLDQLDPSSPVDLVEAYCARLPLTVITEILGVEPEDQERVLTFGTAAAPSLDLGLSWQSFRDVEAALTDFADWLAAHLEHLRANPGDNLMSKLVAAEEDGVGLNDAELKATAGLVLAAGFETTVNLLGNAIVLFDKHPDQLDRLCSEPDLWPNAVDEVLRIDPPVLLTGRMAVRDTTVAGMRVPEGAVVSTLLAGANRDPEVFTDPNTFDVSRANAGEHMAFSAGRHYCLGASLARMEGEVGLKVLYDRYPDLRVLPGAERRTTRILRGFETLPASLSPREG